MSENTFDERGWHPIGASYLSKRHGECMWRVLFCRWTSDGWEFSERVLTGSVDNLTTPQQVQEISTVGESHD